MDWTVAIVVLVFGVIFGGLSGFFVARADNSAVKRAKQLDAELKQTRDELTAFKSQVTQHFSKTAELVNNLTANYRSVYSHLAEGAQRFSSNDAVKLEAMNAADPMISSDSTNDDAGSPESYDKPVSDEKIDEGWYGEHPQESAADEQSRDDRFH